MNTRKTKRNKLAIKRLEKFQEDIQRVESLISRGKTKEAFNLLSDIFESRAEFFQVNAFRGAGNIENWRFYCPKGPIQWFSRAQDEDGIEGNLFDLVAICCAIQLDRNQQVFRVWFERYKQLQGLLGQRYELEVGLGNLYYGDRQFLQAEKYYRRALELHPNCSKVMEYLGWIYYQFKNKQKTLGWCNRCLPLSPRNMYVRLLMLKCHKANLPQLIRLRNEYPGYYRILLSMAVKANSLEAGLDFYERALTFEPGSAVIQAEIGNQLALMKRIPDARQAIDKALRLDMFCGKAFKVLAELACRDKHYQQAVNILKHANRSYPQDFKVTQQLAQIQYINLQNYKEALILYLQYMQLNPYSATNSCRAGIIAQELKRYTLAHSCFTKALQLDPQHAPTLKRLAQHYYEDKKYTKAIDTCARANIVDPNNADTCFLMAKCHYVLEKEHEAQQWVREAIRLTPKQENRAPLYHMMGKICFCLKRLEEGLEWVLKAHNIEGKGQLDRMNQKKINQEGLLPETIRRLIKRVPHQIGNIWALKTLENMSNERFMTEEAQQLKGIIRRLQREAGSVANHEEVIKIEHVQ